MGKVNRKDDETYERDRERRGIAERGEERKW